MSGKGKSPPPPPPPPPTPSDFETLKTGDVQKLSDVQGALGNLTGTSSPLNVALENFYNYHFHDLYNDFHGASTFLANGNDVQWNNISYAMNSALDTFTTSIQNLESQKLWVGKTHDAAMQNVTASLSEITTISAGANTLGSLINMFGETVFQTRWYFEENIDGYNKALQAFPNQQGDVENVFGIYAQDVMNTVYAPTIAGIASKNPGFVNAPPTVRSEQQQQFQQPTAASPSSSAPAPPPPKDPPPPVDPPPPPPPPPPPATANFNTNPPPPVNNVPPPDSGSNGANDASFGPTNVPPPAFGDGTSGAGNVLSSDGSFDPNNPATRRIQVLTAIPAISSAGMGSSIR